MKQINLLKKLYKEGIRPGDKTLYNSEEIEITQLLSNGWVTVRRADGTYTDIPEIIFMIPRGY